MVIKNIKHLFNILFACSTLIFTACGDNTNHTDTIGFADMDVEEADTSDLPQGFEVPRENSVVWMIQQYAETFASAVQRAGLYDLLGTQERYTVFAPSDDALNKNQMNLNNLSEEQLRQLILQHVVPGSLTTSELTDGQVLTTIAGSQLVIRKQNGSIMASNAEIIQPDQAADNGVVHVVDEVIQSKL